MTNIQNAFAFLSSVFVALGEFFQQLLDSIGFGGYFISGFLIIVVFSSLLLPILRGSAAISATPIIRDIGLYRHLEPQHRQKVEAKEAYEYRKSHKAGF